MARTGKIARLPDKIREEINSRLHDGEEVDSILTWLNAQPKTQEILKKSFEGRPISQANMSEWKQGGYQDWLLNETAAKFIDDLRDKDTLGGLPENMADDLVQWVAIQYAVNAKSLIANEPDPMVRWARLREMCNDAARLYRVQIAADRVAQGQSWLDYEQEKELRQIQEKHDDRLRRGQFFLDCLGGKYNFKKIMEEREKQEAQARKSSDHDSHDSHDSHDDTPEEQDTSDESDPE